MTKIIVIIITKYLHDYKNSRIFTEYKAIKSCN